MPNLVTVKLAANGSCASSQQPRRTYSPMWRVFSSASTGGFIDLTPVPVLDMCNGSRRGQASAPARKSRCRFPVAPECQLPEHRR